VPPAGQIQAPAAALQADQAGRAPSAERLHDVAASLRLDPAAAGQVRPAPPDESTERLVAGVGEPAAKSRRRGLLFGLAALLLVLMIVTAGLVTVRPAGLFGAGTKPSAGPALSALPTPSPVLAGAGTGAPMPSAAAVAAALQGPLADPRLGGHFSVRVVDVATGQQLFGRGEADPTTPASTMKLATATALLALRGPAYQIRTKAIAGPNPGEVVLVGGGDPTLAVNGTGSYPGAARLDDLANQVKRALGGTAATKVIVDSSLFSGSTTGPDWDPGDYDAGGQVSRITALMTDAGRTNPAKVGPPSARSTHPDAAAGQAFAKLLGLPASAVVAGTAPPTPTNQVANGSPDPTGSPATGTLAPGTELGAVKSAPLVSLLEQMLASSDNTIAECMARQVALAAGQPASFAGGAQAVTDELTKLGLPMASVKIVDGSGLSADNKLTPQLLTALLALAAQADQPQLHGLFTGLPVAGYSGTLAGRFHSPAANPADGVVRAKTGTLTGVNALAGYVTTASGRLLAFALLADQVTAGMLDAETALDRTATALAQLS
jgi:D-alanyl-D-alanine carboxypeptidase/D-alanyl-D-alanine-endopeptidase (penicillin-binding protein 4)